MFVPTPAHIAAMRATDAWDALCESNGDAPAIQPPHVVAAMALLDTLEESELDAVFEASRPFPVRLWIALESRGVACVPLPQNTPLSFD